MSLTKREKTLLMILVIVAVLAVFIVLIIQPLRETNKNFNNQLLALNDTRTQMDAVLLSEAGIRHNYEEALKEYEKALESFPRKMKSYDIHTMITGLCGSYGIEVDSLNIPDYKTVRTEPSSEQTQAVWMTTVSMTLKGDYQSLLKLEDKIQNLNGYMRIEQFAVAGIDSADVFKSASMSVQIYAVDDPPPSETQAAA